MATTDFAVNHPLARKNWSDKLQREALQQTMALKFMGSDKSSLIYVKDDTAKSKGDKITCGLRTQLTGAGVSGDNTLEGNEEAMSFFNDALYIDQLRHAVRTDGLMSEQRVPYALREECQTALSDWIADRIDTALFNQLCGYTVQTDTKFTGSNAAIAPDSSHKIMWDDSAAANHTAEASLSESDVFTLRHIDRAVEIAQTLGRDGSGKVPIRPVKYKGSDYFVCFIHPAQMTALRNRTNSNDFMDLQRAMIEGGARFSDLPIASGAEFLYNQTFVHTSPRVTYGVNASNVALTRVRRAVFCGAQAASIAFGKGNAGARVDYKEESFDYSNQFGVAGGLIWGAKKSVFNSVDFGTITIPTFALGMV